MQAQDNISFVIGKKRTVGGQDFPVGQPGIAFDSNRDSTDADCKSFGSVYRLQDPIALQGGVGV